MLASGVESMHSLSFGRNLNKIHGSGFRDSVCKSLPMLESVAIDPGGTMKRQFAVLLLLFCSAVLSGSALADSKSEEAIKYRKGVYAVMGWNFRPMAQMVKGERPYEAAAFARDAEIVAYMSKLPLEGFTPGTETGDTKAKPEIWLDMDDFKAKMEKMQGEATKLADLAKGGDFDAIKAQFGETGKACKACHDKYRNK
jgi:cytochrome c556